MRGQAALEFLTTYAWAIAVLVLVTGALYYFGVAEPADARNNDCTLWPEIYCQDSKVLQDGTIHLQLRNNLRELSEARVEMATDDCTLTKDTVTDENIGNNKFLGDNNLITFTCEETLEPQEPFRASITVTYRLRNQAVNHTVTGELKQLVE